MFITRALLSDASSWVFLQLHRNIHHLDGSMAPRTLHHPSMILLLSPGCRGWGACRCLGGKLARRAWMREHKTITMGHLVGLPKLPCHSWFINPFPLNSIQLLHLKPISGSTCLWQVENLHCQKSITIDFEFQEKRVGFLNSKTPVWTRVDQLTFGSTF